MTAVSVLPVAGDVLFDARNDGRSLRVNWHPVDDLCVLSMWRAGRCVATFQLPRSQTPALINSLVNGLAQERPASQPEPAHPTPQPWTEPQLTSVPAGRHEHDAPPASDGLAAAERVASGSRRH